MQFKCHSCHFEREVPQKYAGKKVKCPKCGTSVLVGKPSLAKKVTQSITGKSSDEKIYTLDEFLNEHKEKKLTSKFQLESDRILEFSAADGVWIKTGSMISYKGKVEFVREKIFEFNIKKLLKEILTGEGATLTKAKGSGSVYVCDQGKKITLLKLKGDSIVVNGNDVLAFDKNINWDINLLKSPGAWVAGGLFNMKLSGTGHVAITTHYDPLVLEIKDGQEVTTDPNATVAWSGSVKPEFKTQFQMKTFFGRGSGESIQMGFKGKGFVVLQPYEELPFNIDPNATSGSVKGGTKKAQAVVAGFFILVSLLFGGQSMTKSSSKRDIASRDNSAEIERQLELKRSEELRISTAIRQKGTKVTERDRDKLRKIKKDIRLLESKL